MKKLNFKISPSQKNKQTSSLRLRYNAEGFGWSEKSISYIKVGINDIFDNVKLFDVDKNELLNKIIFDATQLLNNVKTKSFEDFKNGLEEIVDFYNPKLNEQKVKEKQQATLLYNIIYNHVQLKLNDDTLTDNTKDNYKMALLAYKKYEQQHGEKTINDVDFSFMPSYERWLNDTYKYGTADNYQKKIRSFLKNYFQEQNDYQRSACLTVPSTLKRSKRDSNLKKAYFTKEEVYKIYSTDFSYYKPKNKKEESLLNRFNLNDIRNWMVLGYHLGQRISDLMNFAETKIENDRVPSFIQIKTKKLVPSLRIYGAMRHYFENNNYTFPKKINDLGMFNIGMRIICKEMEMNEKMEGYVKGITEDGRIRDIFGIYERWELIHSHTCRRSFITHQQMNNRDTKMAMALTGHENENTFENYNQTSDYHLIEQFYDKYLLKEDDDYFPPNEPNKSKIIKLKAS